MYRNIKSLCCIQGTNIVLLVNYTSKTNKLIDKSLWLPEAAGGERGIGWGRQKVQISSYKTNKYQGCTVQHDKYNYHCCVLYTKAVKRANPKSSHTRKKIFFLFLSFCICTGWWMVTKLHFMIYVSQIIMLSTLNCSVVCQLYLNKARRKIFDF